jgi:(1->4)-alpha-D-glucan 1-alpha-D-glucosylmutase
MTTLSTHDTKRSEDVRARIAVLSEIPGRFSAAIHRWSRMNNAFRSGRSGSFVMPDRNTEYLYYQTLIGAWPLSVERAQQYMLKAAREAKLQTSWTANNKPFEDALRKFIADTLAHPPFLRDLEQFVDRVKDAGRVNSLAQALLKYTAPGVPDTYQGTELWDLSLVDPDNRRPVDYDLRRRLLAELKEMDGPDMAAKIMARADEGLPKMWLVHQTLLLRRERPEWFRAEAAYTPLAVEGSRSDHAIAYLRGDSVAVVVPRLTAKLGGAWRETAVALPEGTWTHRLTGSTVHGGRTLVKSLLSDFPVALLVRNDPAGAIDRPGHDQPEERNHA